MRSAVVSVLLLLLAATPPCGAGEASGLMEWRGLYGGPGTPTQLLARTPEEWARICAVFGLAETPSPDFRTQMAAAVGMGMRLTGGYAVEILGAEEHDGILTIRYRERSPRPNEFVTQAVTAPFHVRLLPRSDAQRVRFERVAGTDG